MPHKDGKWARQILALQREDGTWGSMFHALSMPIPKHPLTTEQALRRLWMLGFSGEDAPVRKTLDTLKACLRGERRIDDYTEKTHDWPLFTRMMLCTWIKVFEPEDAQALVFARQWAGVMEAAFAQGAFDQVAYATAYGAAFSAKTKGSREINPVDFYHVSLLAGVLTPETERRWLDHVLSWPGGMFYVYGRALNHPPETFASREASHYLAALELLAGYGGAKGKLGFAVDWLMANQDAQGQWDFGPGANDGVYFPLSDSWRRAEDRRADCTERVKGFLAKLGR